MPLDKLGESHYLKRKDKVQEGTYEGGMSSIYEWVKNGTIGLREFRKLIQDNRESIS
jgi:hypothetical protein